LKIETLQKYKSKLCIFGEFLFIRDPDLRKFELEYKFSETIKFLLNFVVEHF
jgi:hypothetical protein